MEIRIAPSLLAADFGCLREELRRAEQAGADWLHLDVMDGHFVPNLTIGVPVVKAIRSCTSLFFDVHLMIDNPDKYVERFAEAGADLLTVHLEVCPDPRPVLRKIGELGRKRGLSLNPDMPVEKLEPWLDEVDLILVMSVFPGFGGQEFIPESVERIRRVRKMLGDREVDLEVDGGIYESNVRQVLDAGANVIVAGTATFRAEDMKAAVEALRG